MRDVDMNHLHPAYRAPAEMLLARCRSRNLPIMPYEGWRDPARQSDLWAFGRVSGIGTPNRHKTFERAWQSSHQYGFAADWVWYTGTSTSPQWTWTPPPGHTWDEFFSVVGDFVQLERLKFEEPHIQLRGFNARAVLAGTAQIPRGDASWEANFDAAVAAWGPLERKDRYGVPQPGAPALAQDGRPSIPVPAGMVYDDDRGLCLPSDLASSPDVSAPA